MVREDCVLQQNFIRVVLIRWVATVSLRHGRISSEGPQYMTTVTRATSFVIGFADRLPVKCSICDSW